jgi:hypothetical protein
MLLLIDIFSINKGRGYENPSWEIIVTERCSIGGFPLEEACEHCFLNQTAISIHVLISFMCYCEDYDGYFTVILPFVAFYFCSAYFIYLVSCTKQSHVAFLSMTEPKIFYEDNQHDDWIRAMNEDLDQIENNNTWEIVPRPEDKKVIGSKWVFKNKMNEKGQVVRNKVRLVCKGYAQFEGRDFDENFSPMERLEAIRMFLAYSCHKNFKVYQMYFKSTFLNGDLEEEVYMEKPEGFSLKNNPNYVFKLKKALYGLKQAPRAWYYRLDKFLQDKGFKKGIVDNNLYIKSEGDNLLVVLVYVHDIIFCCTNESSV